ncbi:hypothetical protein [Oricola nitratireducens]|uniref:hypothetical protein n=1 Tax=Oricola nitratireducens TaxID=2775868 RepID=UPI001866A0E6|nr:hypothetical protein [Oricola nitratireducens]
MSLDFRVRVLPRIATVIAVCAFACTGHAMAAGTGGPNHVEEVGRYFEDHVRSWINGPEVVAAIREQNLRTAGFDDATIKAKDDAWRAEVSAEGVDRPMVEEVMQRDVSHFLKQKQRAADWMIVEIILMDAKGLNVGLSTPTSDFWQGDEAKHQKTFQAGSHDPFIDEVEFEAGSGLLLSQISQTIFDPDSGEPIGAVTVSVNMNKL